MVFASEQWDIILLSKELPSGVKSIRSKWYGVKTTLAKRCRDVLSATADVVDG